MSTETRYIAAVGTFDGVHRGHSFLLEHLDTLARDNGLLSRIYTFTDHPLATLAPARAPLLLSTPAEKAHLLTLSGVDSFTIDDFATVQALTAHQYLQRLAADGVSILLVGYDNRFGSDGLTTLQQFKQATRGTGVTILQAPEFDNSDGLPFSSSTIRNHLLSSHIREANQLLGYEYTLTGHVVHGQQLGRTIGFPTANIIAPTRKLVPAGGVYACRAVIGNNTCPAMVNIGHRPTVASPDSPSTIEAHIIGYSGDIYGQDITLQFVDYLRPEQRFPTLEALRAALTRDRQATLKLM